jgi:hypothetical protein
MSSPDVFAANTGKVGKTSGKNQTRQDMTEDFGGGAAPYQVVKEGNSWVLTGTENAKIPGRVYLYIDNNGDYEVMSAEAVQRRYIQDAQSGKGVEYLRQRLYSAGYMQKAEFDTKDRIALARAITEAASNVSVQTVMDFQDSGILIDQSFDKYLNLAVAANQTGPKSGSGLNLTSKIDTDQDIDDYFYSMLGRRATAAEKTDYYNAVNKEEKAALVKQTTGKDGKTVTVGEYLDADDYSRIKANIIKPAIKGTDLEKLGTGKGEVASNVMELKEFAASYGIRLDTKQALDKVMGVFTPSGKADIDSAKNGIKSMAKGFYGNISSLIDEGVKPSDIANQYAYFKGRLLGLPDNTISIFDEDIQAALANKDATGAQKSGVMSIREYEKLLRTSPKTKELWLKSPGAREEASGYAVEILRTFGLMA